MANLKEVKIPDIGSTSDVTVIEVVVKAGDAVKVDQTLITLESEKATMDIPSPSAGIVDSVAVKVGDKVNTGAVILKLKEEGAAAKSEAEPEKKAEAKKSEEKKSEEKQSEEKPAVTEPVKQAAPSTPEITSADIYAGPAARRLARELGINLAQIAGTGRKERVQKDDVINYVKNAMSRGTGTSGAGLPSAPVVDFSKFGETEIKPLSKIKKLTGIAMQRNWLLVPHVTQFEEADITELEVFRNEQKLELEKEGIKLTPLVFIMKAVVAALKAFPTFNSSLDQTSENLILKKYFHIGVAVDTPDGLVVPVIRDVDKKSLVELAKELGEVSAKARKKNLMPADMQGSCFTISSLGGIGGTSFTPIVNLPDVAILGVSKSAMKPVYQDGQFVPRLMLPLSLSYDHRVIDGAEGARFIVFLAKHLADIRQLLLY